MEAPAASATDLGIGARLRAGRERAGLTAIQAAERLHMEPRMVEALDADDFAALGAPVYVRGHLRRYAELVGESATELLERYATILAGTVRPDLGRIARAEEPTDASRRIAVPIAIGIVVIAVVGAISWAMRSAPRPTPAVDGTAPAAPRPAAVDEAPPSGEATGLAGQPPLPASQAGSAPPAGAPRTGTPPSTGAAAPPTPGNAASAPRAAARPSATEVQLRFATDSWTEVYDADGNRLFYDVAAANSEQTLQGRPPLRVVLGHAPGVSVSVNGRSAPIPPKALRDDGAEFIVNGSGRLATSR